MQKILCWLFSKIYTKWLWNKEKVLHVKGWRTARIENKWGQRGTMSPCFLWFK